MGPRYVLLVRASFGGWPHFQSVSEMRPDHIGFLMERGWRLLAVDSDVLGPEPLIDPAQRNPNRTTEDTGED